jgi:carbon storage regulator CsrA
MLIITRKVGEKIHLDCEGEELIIQVISMGSNYVKVGLEATPKVVINRLERLGSDGKGLQDDSKDPN